MNFSTAVPWHDEKYLLVALKMLSRCISNSSQECSKCYWLLKVFIQVRWSRPVIPSHLRAESLNDGTWILNRQTEKTGLTWLYDCRTSSPTCFWFWWVIFSMSTLRKILVTRLTRCRPRLISTQLTIKHFYFQHSTFLSTDGHLHSTMQILWW